MYDLTAFQRDLLAVIAGLDKPNGLVVKRHLEEYYHSEINPGQIYPALDGLAEKGLIGKGKIDRRTNYYSLTKRGNRELVAYTQWVNQNLVEV